MRPTSSYEWCVNEKFQDKVIDGKIVLVKNKEEPDTGVKQTGIPVNSTLLRGYVNYQLSSLGEWVGHFREGTVGDIYMTTVLTTTATDVMLDKLNTWIDLGTDTIAGESVRVFKRTA